MKRPGTWSPVMTLILAAAIVATFALELVGDGADFCARFGFTAADAALGTALSSLFLHSPSDWTHVGGNLACLLLIGVAVERDLGHVRFALLYVLSGLGGCAMHWLADPNTANALIGCSACCSGLLAAIAMIRPRLVGFAVGFMTWQLWCLWTSSGGAVSVAAHCGGFVTGFVMTAVVFERRLTGVPGSRRVRRAGGFALV